MPLSWNEIRANATRFAHEWATETREHAEAKTFWDEFFAVFGLRRRHLASFEEPVKGLSGSYGFIDLFWKGMLLAEHKSAGKDLGKAHAQAMDYIQSLQREGRSNEVPRFVIVSDFRRLALHNLNDNESIEFPIGDFPKRVQDFGFIPGYRQQKFAPQDPVNIAAVEVMGNLHDTLEVGGYTGHELEVFLVRVLFCLFAEDTGIFNRNAFQFFVEDHTQPDGSDLGGQIGHFFQILNTPREKRQKNLLLELDELPYVNGELFAERLSFVSFDSKMREQLLTCTRFDWSQISPAVFGALFQSVMEPRERRQTGAHYTSERDIMKVIGPLFLDELKDSLEAAKSDTRKLKALHERIASLKLLDPACGCGNFLVVAYRELRLLELEILKRLYLKDHTQPVFDIETMVRADVDQMFGIEIEEWPARIAEVALWLVDHQMNNLFSSVFGEYFVRLPLKKSPHIVHANALRIDWNDVVPASECSYVFGNPPFVGYSMQTDEQKQDLKSIADVAQNGLLDFVTGWYFKAAKYIRESSTAVAFVSTNSISQGQTVGALWDPLTSRFGVDITFAHRTFQWESEARGKAHVHVVIIGFSRQPKRQKFIVDYDVDENNPSIVGVSKINGYLIEGNHVYVNNRTKPLSACPIIRSGCKPVDDQNYLFTDDEKNAFVNSEPASAKYFRIWYGADEFINGFYRWCLWLGDVDPKTLRQMPSVMQRIENVRTFRLASKKDANSQVFRRDLKSRQFQIVLSY